MDLTNRHHFHRGLLQNSHALAEHVYTSTQNKSAVNTAATPSQSALQSTVTLPKPEASQGHKTYAAHIPVIKTRADKKQQASTAAPNPTPKTNPWLTPRRNLRKTPDQKNLKTRTERFFSSEKQTNSPKINSPDFWRAGRGIIEKVDKTTGEIMYLAE